MREALAQRAGARGRYFATFERFGVKPAYKGPPLTTLLLRDVKDSAGELVTDHLWFNLTTEFAALGLCPGDRVAFDGRSTSYVKGYKGRREYDERPAPSTDYRLSHPTKVEVLSRSGTAAPGGHHCHAEGCTVPVAPELLMCSAHWSMVPKGDRDAVWKHYRRGQCDDKRPSPEWCAAADGVVAFVAQREGKPPPKLTFTLAFAASRLPVARISADASEMDKTQFFAALGALETKPVPLPSSPEQLAFEVLR